MSIRLNQLSKKQIEQYNANCPDGLIQPETLKKNLSFLQIEDFIEITSTNNYLKKTKFHLPCLCYSEYQTEGKGRLGRDWQSPFGLNLYFSLAWEFNCPIQKLQGLSLCVGLAISDALETQCKIQNIKVKWPNDIVFEHQKLAGILIEINHSTVDRTQTIIGVGINVNSFPKHMPDIKRKWTSIAQISGKIIHREALLIDTIKTLQIYLHQFESHGFAKFMAEWQTRDALFGEKIAIKQHHQFLNGIAKGVTTQGHLVLQEGVHTRLVDVGDATLSI